MHNSNSEEHAKSLDINGPMKFMSKLGLNDLNCQNLIRSQNQYLDNSNY